MENVLVCVSPSFQNSVSLCQVICQICPHQWKTENGYIYAPIPQWYLKYKQTIQYIFQYFFFFFKSWFGIVNEYTCTMICTWTCWKLTCAMSHAVTWSFRATKSKECTLCATFLAIFASPHPKSATTLLPGLKSKNDTFTWPTSSFAPRFIHIDLSLSNKVSTYNCLMSLMNKSTGFAGHLLTWVWNPWW